MFLFQVIAQDSYHTRYNRCLRTRTFICGAHKIAFVYFDNVVSHPVKSFQVLDSMTTYDSTPAYVLLYVVIYLRLLFVVFSSRGLRFDVAPFFVATAEVMSSESVKVRQPLNQSINQYLR